MKLGSTKLNPFSTQNPFRFLILLYVNLIALTGFSRDLTGNFSFNSSTSFPIAADQTSEYISARAFTSGSFVANTNGTSTFPTAFVQNSVAGAGLEIQNPTGSEVYFQFDFGGYNLAFSKEHKIYFQAKGVSTNITSLVLTYSTDGVTFNTITGPNTAPISSVYAEFQFDLSGLTDINNKSLVSFRLTASAPDGNGYLSVDNFQVSSINPIHAVTRGMYIQNFYKYYVESAPAHLERLDELYSTLASGDWLASSNLYSKEKELLDFCKDAHITHLIFYDLPKLLPTLYVLDDRGITMSDDLCRFMTEAKNNYCIETFSVAVSRKSEADMVNNFDMNFSPLVLTSAEQSRIANPNIINGLQTIDSSITDTVLRKNIQLFRMAITLDRYNTTNGNICPDFDFFATEYEYWNPGGLFGTFRTLVDDLKILAPNLPIEGYSFSFSAADETNPTTFADYYDNLSNPTYKNIERTLLVDYNHATQVIEHPFLDNRIYTINNELKNNSVSKSLIVPLFTSESGNLQDHFEGPTGAGSWMSNPYEIDNNGGDDQLIARNIFTVEKHFYDEWRSNLSGLSTNINNSSEKHVYLRHYNYAKIIN